MVENQIKKFIKRYTGNLRFPLTGRYGLKGSGILSPKNGESNGDGHRRLTPAGSLHLVGGFGFWRLRNPKSWVLPPLSNSWITLIVWLYLALNRTPNIDCYWVGQYPT